MEQFLFLLLVSALTGFVAGVFGSVCHQYHQRNADQKRWKELSTCVCDHTSGNFCDKCDLGGKRKAAHRTETKKED
jgi:hypothetical protein